MSGFKWDFLGQSSDARTLLEDYLIGELAEADRTEYKNQYVYTDQNKEGGPTPMKWVAGMSVFRDRKHILQKFYVKILFRNS